jgi:hypothetical protein
MYIEESAGQEKKELEPQPYTQNHPTKTVGIESNTINSNSGSNSGSGGVDRLTAP